MDTLERGNRAVQNTLEPYWMPFTGNRHFKRNPRLLAAADGMYYTSDDGRKILDGTAGLWCVNAGHGRREITEAIQRQAAKLDYAPSFQLSHPIAFELAARLTATLPGDFDYVFYANSGSEAVDTALKIALAYHQAKGEFRRTRLIGRERSYHGVGFGGISVGGIVGNRKAFASALLPQVDHLPHTHNIEKNAFSRGQPEWGAHLADALESLCALHDPATVAAVIVEPVAGSTGVLVPPKGYLERLRALCDKHGILLIFDEVITGFGRLGAPFAAEFFGVMPDLMAVAKGLTNAAVPMGAVFARKGIYQAFMQGPENAIELFHGYTYSGHPLACAAALATIEIHRREGLAERAKAISPYWETAIHGLKDAKHV
ncbi:MAG: aminotransferase class III-fold pyridoxal phosphate-dependent enzyme, partial [Alphaproteobacteria bacterium]